MKKSKRLKCIGTEDRIGMIYDVLKAMVHYGVNIITMEVNPFICMNIEWDEEKSWHDFRNYMIDQVDELIDLVEIDLMGYEKKEKELNEIINTINEGIIAIDGKGNITYFNKKAREIFEVLEYDAGDKHINKIIPYRVFNMDTHARNNNNVELNLFDGKNRISILMDVRIIRNEVGTVTGALIILKKMEEIRQMIHTISGPSMVVFEDIVGESQALHNAISMAKSVAPSNSSIMLRGESGTGKELFARAIHMSSRRSENPFIAINCAAVPDSLLESEFFGYEKGSFTGAVSTGKQGLFEMATGGTLFLDEIGDLSPRLQAKLLRVLQEQKVRRIGGKQEIPIDIRVISATNKNLEKMVLDGTFREDLYYRLNVIPIFIPPLRERKEDIPILVKYMIKILGKDTGKCFIQVSDEAMAKLMAYDWPGNVRELNNVIERAIILADDKITKEHLVFDKGTVETSECETVNLHNNENALPITLPVDLPGLIKSIETKYLKQASEKYNSSRKIAKALGISHTTVIEKLKKLKSDEINDK